MTRTIIEAINAYAQNPSGHNRERGMSLIAEGHLSPVEVARLEWAIKQYRERVANTV